MKEEDKIKKAVKEKVGAAINNIRNEENNSTTLLLLESVYKEVLNEEP
ncbi:MAG: hypothetical protein ACOC56_03850 [Atribacterota bacterium]